jgi:GNAT superfamily N-acetyltransferase
MALPEHAAPGHTIRRLWPGDRPAVLDYFLRLDPETRANRFMGPLNEAGVRAYAERAVAAEGLVVGAFVDGVLRGLGELRPAGTPRGFMLGAEAEAAFAVEPAFRRQGIGTALFGRIARAARNRGVGILHVRCLDRNKPMLRLAAKLGADLHRGRREARGDLQLAQATPFSLWYEGIAEAYDFTLSVIQPALREESAA